MGALASAGGDAVGTALSHAREPPLGTGAGSLRVRRGSDLFRPVSIWSNTQQVQSFRL